MQDWWLTIAFFLFFVGGWLFTTLAEKFRLKGLTKTAADNDLELLLTPPKMDLDRFLTFPFAGQAGAGSPGRAFVLDNDQTRVTLFDYQIAIGEGKGRKVTHYSLALVSDSRMDMPATRIMKSTLTSRLFELTGKKTIRLEDDPNFSQEFQINGLSEEECVAFLSLSRRNAIREAKLLSLEMVGRTFLAEFARKRLSGADFRPYLSTCLSLAKTMREQPS